MHIEDEATRDLELGPSLLNTGNEMPVGRIDEIFPSDLWKDIFKEYESSFGTKKGCSGRNRSSYLSDE